MEHVLSAVVEFWGVRLDLFPLLHGCPVLVGTQSLLWTAALKHLGGYGTTEGTLQTKV